MTNVNEKALAISKKFGGKLEIISKVPIETMEDLSIAYTPGVAAVCMEIANNKESVYTYTTKKNLVAVITDGSAVLGLGNIGPEAAIPVMEGKAALFKRFGNVDAVPISLNTQDVEEIISHVAAIAPSFGGINLEDISAPRCFEIERRLKEMLDIPVFHDDQHGTAIIVLAALYNALRLTGKKIDEIQVVVNGGGAAGIAISQMFLSAGIKNLMVVDRTGIISETDPELAERHVEISKVTNRSFRTGTLEDAVVGMDVFVGVSAPGVLKKEWIATMNEKPVIFAMANPTPEIFPDEAKAGGAYIVGTGRSDFPNQINNVLAFPGIFRGALDARAKDITIEMQLAAARGIASIVSDEELNVDYIMPDVFTPGVADIVAASVMNAVKKEEVLV
ncbi:NADP-dependent malic enzyme [Trichococcus sp. K1Tr]|uniref:NAD(P)-dependent malic enzyme n=1 Tax=Trichococcus sp. K1Tr TaxID=3020847 RepID=UPI00232B7CFE|nr:NADP-dependent malic enzyme [Trichococcus sp. K1Tr]MDB6354337.1 NADP-dependent malic enzyme [Trichococcus sp. K1Tr]